MTALNFLTAASGARGYTAHIGDGDAFGPQAKVENRANRIITVHGFNEATFNIICNTRWHHEY
jgi:hypothetical protein